MLNSAINNNEIFLPGFIFNSVSATMLRIQEKKANDWRLFVNYQKIIYSYSSLELYWSNPIIGYLIQTQCTTGTTFHITMQ